MNAVHGSRAIGRARVVATLNPGQRVSHPTFGTASDAILAVSRLLSAAVEQQGPVAVQRTLVREARAFFGIPRVALLAVDAAAERVEVVALDDEGPGRAPASVQVRDIPALGELLSGGTDRMRVDGPPAQRIAHRLRLGDAIGMVLLLPVDAAGPGRHVLALADFEPGALSDAAVEVAVAFARAAAAALSELQLAEEHAQQIAQQSALSRAAEVLHASLDLPSVLTRICEEAAAILDADNAAVYRGDATGGVEIEAAHGLAPDAVGTRLAAGEGLAGKVIQTGEAMLTNDYPGFTEVRPGSIFTAVRGAMAAPLRWDGEVRGVLSVGYRRSCRLEPDRLHLLETFAELAAVAFRNASAHAGVAEAARTDALTGCLNQGALHEILKREIDRSRRSGHPLSLVLLDVDGLKAVNDVHGHLVGDELLRRTGHAIRHAVRAYDLVARYGGDEFAIVAVEADEATASEVAHRAINRIVSANADLGSGDDGSATAGVAGWDPNLGLTELIDRADRTLLIAKGGERRGGAMRCDEVPAEQRTDWAPTAPVPAARQGQALPGAVLEQTERLRRRTRQLSLANAIGARLSAMTDVAEILDAVVDELQRALGHFHCEVVRIREDGHVEAVAGRGDAFEAKRSERWCQPRSRGIIGRALLERATVMVNDVCQEPAYVPTPETDSVGSELCAPVWVGEALWGAINIEELGADAFDEDDARLIGTVADQLGSALRSALLYDRLERGYLGTAEALAAALEAKDAYTAGHARSIVRYAEAVGRRLGLDEQSIRDLRYGAALHDIGKIAVPEAILNKRGPLTDEELVVVRRHTIVGEQILEPIEFLADVLPLVRHEHERWDGAGYPDGLRGEEIPLGARIIFACDAFHAMTTDRAYRGAMSPLDARAELSRNAGSQFDPAVVAALLTVLDEESLPLGPLGPLAAAG